MPKPLTPMPASTPAPMQPAFPSGNPGGQPQDISADMAALVPHAPAPHVPSVAAIGTGDLMTPVEAEPVVPPEPVVLYYIGDGMHTVPGLPGRNLTQYDIDTSPYRNEPARILKFTPAVFQERQADANPSGTHRSFVASREHQESTSAEVGDIADIIGPKE